MTSTKTARAPSISRKPSPRARNSSSSKTASGNGSGRIGERATRLAREYNDRFNNLRLRNFDGSHLTLPGMVREHLRDGDLARHQKDAVWRILQSGSTLLAHVVGAGKTWTMAAAAMEMRRLGLAKKPMFVVPNHLVEQWGAEFLKLYPQAQALHRRQGAFRDRQPPARDGAHRDRQLRRRDRLAPLVRVSAGLRQAVQPLRRRTGRSNSKTRSSKPRPRSGDNRRIVKELEKAKKRLAAKLKKRADRERKDNAITFEELGVDQIFVDEADLYKNLFYTTKMNRIAGLPNSDSNRAFDMFMKTRYLRS